MAISTQTHTHAHTKTFFKCFTNKKTFYQNKLLRKIYRNVGIIQKALKYFLTLFNRLEKM